MKDILTQIAKVQGTINRINAVTQSLHSIRHLPEMQTETSRKFMQDLVRAKQLQEIKRGHLIEESFKDE